jgi:hypothetical protein
VPPSRPSHETAPLVIGTAIELFTMKQALHLGPIKFNIKQSGNYHVKWFFIYSLYHLSAIPQYFKWIQFFFNINYKNSISLLMYPSHYWDTGLPCELHINRTGHNYTWAKCKMVGATQMVGSTLRISNKCGSLTWNKFLMKSVTNLK